MSETVKFLTVSVLGLVMVLGIGAIYAQSSDQVVIPNWVKQNALWWGEGEISDQEFVSALQYLINQGVIIIPATESVDTSEAQSPDLGSGNTLPTVDLPFTIDLRFEQAQYNSGATARILMDTSATGSEDIRIGVFDSSGRMIHEDTVKVNDFGTAASEFAVPTYYQRDEPIEVTAFFARDPNDKYTTDALVRAIKMDLSTSELILSENPTPIVIKLSNAVSEDIVLRVLDSKRNVLHEDTVTTNDFGTATSEFVAPKYYLANEPVEVTAFFENAPTREENARSTVALTKVLLEFSADKDPRIYEEGEPITITITTDPPISTAVELFTGDCSMVGESTIYTDANGEGTFEGKIGNRSIYACTNSGFTVVAEDDHLFEFDGLRIEVVR